jgi:hypothetical protein
MRRASPGYRKGSAPESVFDAPAQSLYEERFQSMGAVASALHRVDPKSHGSHHAHALAATMTFTPGLLGGPANTL